MNHDKIKDIAAQFLISKSIKFVRDGKVISITPNMSEVIFLVHEALDPNAIVDPADVRVIVDHNSQNCELVIQM